MSLSDADKDLARRTLDILKSGRSADRQAALDSLDRLRLETVNPDPSASQERLDAWLAISTLYETLTERPASPDLPRQWEDAIDKVDAWLRTMQ